MWTFLGRLTDGNGGRNAQIPSKYVNAVRNPLTSADISIFYQRFAIFVTSQNKGKNSILIHKLWFFWLLLRFLLRLFWSTRLQFWWCQQNWLFQTLKQLYFEIKVMRPTYDVINEISSLNLNYIVNMAMKPKFDYSIISMKEVFITLILQGFDQKNPVFLTGGLGSSSIIYDWFQLLPWKLKAVWQKFQN